MVIITGFTAEPDRRNNRAFRGATTRSRCPREGLSTPAFGAVIVISASTDYYHGLLAARGNSQSRPKSRASPKIGGTQTSRKAEGTRCSVSKCVVLSEVWSHRETSDYYHGLLGPTLLDDTSQVLVSLDGRPA